MRRGMNPTPSRLQFTPGSCLLVVLQYHATERCARICEFVVESDDPAMREKVIDVQAYTIRDGGYRDEVRREGYRRKHCEDCRHGCHYGYRCSCCDDEDD